MMPSDIETYRIRYKPKKIKILFIGESPPTNGTFFYLCNSNLYFYTRDAFAKVFGEEVGYGEDFLKYFKMHGCYLDDLFVKESNIDDCILLLGERIKKYNPLVIIIVIKRINKYVLTVIESVNISEFIGYPPLPFPAYSDRNKRTYVAKLSELLQKMKERGII